MHCREFRNKHVAYVDDLLPAREMDAMRRHLAVCSGCSRQDVKVRRSLLLVRNLPSIAPSPDFMERLNARLAAERAVAAGPRRDDVVRPQLPASTVGTFAMVTALAAGIAAVAYLAVETNNYFSRPEGGAGVSSPLVAVAAVAPNAQPRMREVVPVDQPFPNATLSNATLSNAALVAAVPTGIPVWPAVLMVGQSPLRFANLERQESEQQTR